MLEIKAFIRVNMVDKVIRAPEGAGISNVTVIDVRAIWTGLTRVPDVRYSVELAEKYMNVVKLETLVRDEDGDRVLDLIRNAARTDRPGDGIVYAMRVESALHVRTGRRGEEILRK